MSPDAHVHAQAQVQEAAARAADKPHSIWRVIFASATGTMIEWYDFFIFGSLASTLSLKFYPAGNDTFAYVAYLATFAVGFLVRPFGALFFGMIGDRVGRRYAFLVTLSIMGGSTALIGLLPTFKTAGWFAPIALIAIRMLQGLALGGEYGGATVYVAEHVADNRRGFYTSFIQITATFGLFASLLVILLTQQSMTKEAFSDWGWRIPFLVSIILVSISLYTRLKMKESPIFQQIKSAGMTCAQPLRDAFTKWENLKRVLISLLGATAGQGVIWYTGQFYALFYLQTILKVPAKTSNIIVAVALLCAMPFFVIFAALSDRVGRKWIMMAACLVAIVAYLPIYHGMQRAAGNNVVTVKSAKNKVTGAISLTAMTSDATGAVVPAADATNANLPALTGLVFLQVLIVCMIYGPIAAYLVEAFPAKVRYTSLSLPYHIG
ncbi:MAG: MFS transporter, partial [Candidatus Acidiferrales bacterium]